jgi:ribosomal protein S18 acetylase RimI-like enzyme
MITIQLLGPQQSSAYRKARLDCLYHFPDKFGTTYEDEAVKPVLFMESMLLEENPNVFMFGAFERENCIGLCGFIREGRTRTMHRGELVQMYVHPNYHGKGIAKQLVQHTIEEAFRIPGIEQISLSAVANNTAAIRLYEKMGFEHYGLAKNYFRVTDNTYTDQVFMICYKK